LIFIVGLLLMIACSALNRGEVGFVLPFWLYLAALSFSIGWGMSSSTKPLGKSALLAWVINAVLYALPSLLWAPRPWLRDFLGMSLLLSLAAPIGVCWGAGWQKAREQLGREEGSADN